MNINQLEALIYVARHGTFKQAAEALYFDSNGEEFITSEAIQYRIKQLEKELGVTLYNKRQGTSHVTLTREGHLLLREAIDVCQRVNDWRTLLGEQGEGKLTIATTQAVLVNRLVPPLMQFHQRFPKVRLHAINANAQEIESLVQAGRVDFGITTRPPEHPDLEYFVWSTSKLVVVCPPDHPLAGRRTVALDDVAPYPLVLLEPELRGDREVVDDAFRRAGIARPNIVMETSNSEIIMAFVEAGLGVGIISETSLLRHRRRINVVQLSGNVLGQSEAGLVVRYGQYLPSVAREFLHMLDEKFAEWLTRRDSSVAPAELPSSLAPAAVPPVRPAAVSPARGRAARS